MPSKIPLSISVSCLPKEHLFNYLVLLTTGT
jgi:hypothetical protein